MKKSQSRDRQRIADLVRKDLKSKPSAMAAIADLLPEGREKKWATGVRQNRNDAEPMMQEIRALYPTISIDELNYPTQAYPDAIPILIKWLPKIQNLNVKAGIVQKLTDPWVGPLGVKAVIAELRRLIDALPVSKARDIRLSVMAGSLNRALRQEDEGDVVALMRHPGTPNDMALTLLLSAGKLKGPMMLKTIKTFLNKDDPSTVVWALKAARRVRTSTDAKRVRELLTHHDAGVRKEAEKTLAFIKKLSSHGPRNSKKHSTRRP